MIQRTPKEPTLLEQLIKKKVKPELPPEPPPVIDYSPQINSLKLEIAKLKSLVESVAQDVALANSAIMNIPKPVIPTYNIEFAIIKERIIDLERETSLINELKQDDKQLNNRINDAYKTINGVIDAINQIPARSWRGGITVIGNGASTAIFTSGTTGLVPASNGGTANYLRADGLFTSPPSGGTPSGTVIAETAYSIAVGAGTSSEYSRGDHTHGSVVDLVSGTAHASLTTGVHSLGTMALQASADFATTTIHAAHTATDASHGAATIASMTSIVAHAALTTVHSLGSIASLASGDFATTTAYAAHTTSDNVHGAGTVASVAAVTAQITTHAGSASNVHGSGTATLATTANITTHAALTSVHSLGTASTAASVSYALTSTYAAHTIDTAAHLGGAGTVASSAAVTALITTHASSILGTGTHGMVAFVSGTVTISSSVMTDITGLVASAGTTSSKYLFTAHIANSCSLTAGVQFSFGWTGAGASALVEAAIFGASTTAATTKSASLTAFATKSAVFNAAAAISNIFITGVVTTAGTTGNFSIQHCSGSATGTITARANSYLQWIKIV